MSRTTKSEMVSECQALYKKLNFLDGGHDNIWLHSYDVHEYAPLPKLKEQYETYMAVKDDIEAMYCCLNKVIARTMEHALDGVCQYYHVKQPIRIEYRVYPPKAGRIGIFDW